MGANDQDSGRIRILSTEILSDDWSILKKTTFEYLRRDGNWQKQSRETYDRGNGAAILLYNKSEHKVILTRQFRFPAYVNGFSGHLIEVAAGVLDEASPEVRVKKEAEEETGYLVQKVEKVFESYMSPGSVTEKLFFFIAEYTSASKKSKGGGLVDEGEDIEVLELDFDQAFKMISTGEIVDAKTIMLLYHAKIHLFT